jgi:peptide/nickel transport system substrate-binding protein
MSSDGSFGAPDYWQRHQVKRRHILKGAAGVGGTLALSSLLAACGGGSESEESGGGVSFTKPEDTTGKAQRGGIFRFALSEDVPGMDWRIQGGAGIGGVSQWVYSPLLRFKPGVLKPADGSIEGDLAQSWEFSADGLQVTFKLRPDVFWDQRAPTNGRAFEAADVGFTWDSYSKIGTRRSEILNGPNLDGSVTGVQVVDKQTVVFKLAYPDPLLLTLLASTGHLLMAPPEADGQFDMRATSRGIAPWIIQEYQQSQQITYRRSPNWYRKDRPFLDGFDAYIVPDYAQRLAQYKARNVWNHVASREDVITLKRDEPDLLLLRGAFPLTWSCLQLGWGANS